MPPTVLLARDWNSQLANLIRCASADLLISSPYVTRVGCRFILDNMSGTFRTGGTLRVLTNLSPVNICQGATDPGSLCLLTSELANVETVHLPRLHAKVYVADLESAIITSANLTAGGLQHNYEYGLALRDVEIIQTIRTDILSYAGLGARLGPDELRTYGEIAQRVRETYRSQITAASQSARREFARAVRTADDELVRVQLDQGPMHTVFARTIVYLLGKYGPLSTPQLHASIEQIHPDLCDNTIDRVIDGKRFGKRWKHAVRSAQQHLKGRGIIRLVAGSWRLISGADVGR